MMAEPRRIDENPATPADVTERRPPSRDTESRRHLLNDEPVRSPESEPALSPETDLPPEDSATVLTAASTERETGNVAAQPARRVTNDQDTTADQSVLLFADADVENYRQRWSSIQTAFVDEPRKAVEDADSLVRTVLNNLSEVFARERKTLANQWERGDKISTEDLRITLQRYRSFFDRLLSV